MCGTMCQISVVFVTLLESQQVPEIKRRTDATSFRLIPPQRTGSAHLRPAASATDDLPGRKGADRLVASNRG